MDKCNECIHAKFRRGTSRGVMDCNPNEYWCDVDQEEYFCADETEFDIDCPDFNNINYDEPDPDYLYDLWRDLKYEEKTL